MKLGLKIEITSQGAGTAAKTLNSTPILEKYASASRSFIKDAFPAREDLKLNGLDPSYSLDESARTVIFLRFLGPDGYLICIFQARPENSGRPFDGAAAWIYVPSSVFLTGVETENLIDEVESAMAEERGINYSRLTLTFEKEYEKKKIIPAVSAIVSNGNSSAVRYYGMGTDYQLNELLGDGIAQPVYGEYKAIFFLRKNDPIKISVPEITTPLFQTCIISASIPVEGYSAFFENGKPFNIDLEYPINTPLSIIWKKKGYQDIRKTALVVKGKSVSDLFAINSREIKIAIKKEIFNVLGENRRLSKYEIYIDGDLLDSVLYIPERKLAEGVNVQVTADGYRRYSKNIVLSINVNSVDIRLEKATYSYKFAIPLYKEKRKIGEGTFLVTLDQKIEKSPVEGYSLINEHIREGEDVINRLRLGTLLAKKKLFIYISLVCVVIILISLLVTFIKKIEDVKLNFGWPPVEFVMQTNTESSALGSHLNEYTSNNGFSQDEALSTNMMAIAYLNSNNIWSEDSIAKYSLLDGLFDDLNQYRFDKIVNDWTEKLKNVHCFTKIHNAAKKALKNNWNPRQGEHNPEYNSVGTIEIDDYVEWISSDQTPTETIKKPVSLPDKDKLKIKSEEQSKKEKDKKHKRGDVL